MGKISEAQEILKNLGLPIPQQNENVGTDTACFMQYQGR